MLWFISAVQLFAWYGLYRWHKELAQRENKLKGDRK